MRRDEGRRRILRRIANDYFDIYDLGMAVVLDWFRLAFVLAPTLPLLYFQSFRLFLIVMALGACWGYWRILRPIPEFEPHQLPFFYRSVTEKRILEFGGFTAWLSIVVGVFLVFSRGLEFPRITALLPFFVLTSAAIYQTTIRFMRLPPGKQRDEFYEEIKEQRVTGYMLITILVVTIIVFQVVMGGG